MACDLERYRNNAEIYIYNSIDMSLTAVVILKSDSISYHFGKHRYISYLPICSLLFIDNQHLFVVFCVVVILVPENDK